jgi:hypothetical protein
MRGGKKITLPSNIDSLGGIVAVTWVIQHQIHVFSKRNSAIGTFGNATSDRITQRRIEIIGYLCAHKKIAGEQGSPLR